MHKYLLITVNCIYMCTLSCVYSVCVHVCVCVCACVLTQCHMRLNFYSEVTLDSLGLWTQAVNVNMFTLKVSGHKGPKNNSTSEITVNNRSAINKTPTCTCMYTCHIIQHTDQTIITCTCNEA